MKTQNLSALVFRSEDPERLAAFYRRHLDIPFAPHDHGEVSTHQEASLHGIHLAVLPRTDAEPHLAPTFRVRELDAYVQHLTANGHPPLREPLCLDDNMRVASFRDIDGNSFNLIEIFRKA